MVFTAVVALVLAGGGTASEYSAVLVGLLCGGVCGALLWVFSPWPAHGRPNRPGERTLIEIKRQWSLSSG
jgi:hypothetical protein